MTLLSRSSWESASAPASVSLSLLVGAPPPKADEGAEDEEDAVVVVATVILKALSSFWSAVTAVMVAYGKMYKAALGLVSTGLTTATWSGHSCSKHRSVTHRAPMRVAGNTHFRGNSSAALIDSILLVAPKVSKK